MDPRAVITQWIQERWLEQDAPALRLAAPGFALVGCYTAGQGKDVLWGLMRIIARVEP